jgi:membrane protein required for beta-lactamase induction
MGRIILGLVAAFIVIMLVLAVVHVVLYYAFFIGLIAVVALGVFALGRRAGRRDGRRS